MNSPECSDTRVILSFKAIIFNFPVFIGSNAAVTGFKSGFIECLIAAIIKPYFDTFFMQFRGPVYVRKFFIFLIDFKIRFIFQKWGMI